MLPIQICKPRLKYLNANKSPNMNSKPRTPSKCYKHIALFSLNNVTKVCDIVQNNDDTDLFGILCRMPNEKDKFYSFKTISSASSGSSSNPNNMTMSSQSSSGQYHHGGGGNHHAAYSSNVSVNNLANTAAHNLTSSTTIYASTTNLNLNMCDENHFQAMSEKKEYIKLLAQGICNVKCITEYVTFFFRKCFSTSLINKTIFVCLY
jgi:hypothetical protein